MSLPWEEENKTMKKIPTKKVLITLGVLVVGALISLSLWFNFQIYEELSFWMKYSDGIYQQGIKIGTEQGISQGKEQGRLDAIQQIILQLQQTGQVMFTGPQGNIILVPKQ